MTRASILAVSLCLALAPLARAQQIDESAQGVRVRARLCASPASGAPREEAVGTVTGHDSAVLVLGGRNGLTRLPMARVQSLEANTRPERDFRTLGVVVGLIGTPLWARALTGKQGDDGGVEIITIPIGALIGMVGGYLLGGLASDDGAWTPLTLAPGQGSGC
jgi:hypothetical protein